MAVSYPAPVISWVGVGQSENITKHDRRPELKLHCPPEGNISKILFATFGTPSGDCESYTVGSCHSSNSSAVLENVSFSFFIDICFWRLIFKQWQYDFVHALEISVVMMLWFSQACIGRTTCTIPVLSTTFGGDPCPGVHKALLVDAECAWKFTVLEPFMFFWSRILDNNECN